MKRIWNSLSLAFSMYSIIPARQTEKTKENMRYLLCFVPWVGAVMAFLIAERRIIHPYLLDYEFLRSVVCVMIPLLLSGGAHMDGFFRTVDALSSHQPRKGKLDILQDSHSGYFAIITCVSYFLIIVGLWSEMPIDGWLVVVFGFILSRSLYGLSILWFPHTRESKCSLYVPEDGKGKTAVTVVLVLYTALCVFFMMHMNLTVGIGCLAGAVLAFLYYCWVAFKHFGGITEDIASFFVQVCEILIPLMALLIYRMPTDFTSF